MAKKGCLDGCIFYKPIHLDEMKEKYHFRCKKYNKFLHKDELKLRCSQYSGKYRIKEHSLDEFLD